MSENQQGDGDGEYTIAERHQSNGVAANGGRVDPRLALHTRELAGQRTQRIIGDVSAAPPRATHVGRRIDQGLCAKVPPWRRGRTGGCHSQVEHHVVVRL
jgi:hypothetical protein